MHKFSNLNSCPQFFLSPQKILLPLKIKQNVAVYVPLVMLYS